MIGQKTSRLPIWILRRLGLWISSLLALNILNARAREKRWWEKYAKDYYPKRAVDFDMSRHSPEHLQDFLRVEMNYAFVAKKPVKLLE